MTTAEALEETLQKVMAVEPPGDFFLLNLPLGDGTEFVHNVPELVVWTPDTSAMMLQTRHGPVYILEDERLPARTVQLQRGVFQ